MSQINHHNTISALMRALSALLQPTAEAMRSGGITNLSMCDGKFIILLENGHIFDGTVHPGQRAGDPVSDGPQAEATTCPEESSTAPDTATEQMAADGAGTFGVESETDLGRSRVEFLDADEKGCVLQESSRAVCKNDDGTVDSPLGWLWLGIVDDAPKILKIDAFQRGIPVPPGPLTGWMPYPGIPPEVSFSTQMHLDETQVRGLIDRLTLWLETGSISYDAWSWKPVL